MLSLILYSSGHPLFMAPGILSFFRQFFGLQDLQRVFSLLNFTFETCLVYDDTFLIHTWSTRPRLYDSLFHTSGSNELPVLMLVYWILPFIVVRSEIVVCGTEDEGHVRVMGGICSLTRPVFIKFHFVQTPLGFISS
jgi:hypothetical protein